MAFMRSFFKDRAGSTAIEYGLMVSLIILVLIGALAVMSRGVNQNLNKAGQSLAST